MIEYRDHHHFPGVRILHPTIKTPHTLFSFIPYHPFWLPLRGVFCGCYKANWMNWDVKYTSLIHFFIFRNPREASSRSWIFLFSLVYEGMYVFMCVFVYVCHTSWSNEKQYWPEIWYTNSPRPYLKTSFCFFEKITLKAVSLEKLMRHIDFCLFQSISRFYSHWSFLAVMFDK